MWMCNKEEKEYWSILCLGWRLLEHRYTRKKNEEYSIGASMDIFLISQSIFIHGNEKARERNMTYYPGDRTMIFVVFEN